MSDYFYIAIALQAELEEMSMIFADGQLCTFFESGLDMIEARADDLAQKVLVTRGSKSCFTISSLNESTFHAFSRISSGLTRFISYMFTEPTGNKHENICLRLNNIESNRDIMMISTK